MQNNQQDEIERRRRCLLQLIATSGAAYINAMYYKSLALLRLKI